MRKSEKDQITVVGAGVTLEEAIKAHDKLKKEGYNIRVVDPFTLKPIDKDLLIECANATGKLVLTVEDHYDQGMCVSYIIIVHCNYSALQSVMPWTPKLMAF